MIQDESGSNALSAPSLKLVVPATPVCQDAENAQVFIFKMADIKTVFKSMKIGLSNLGPNGLEINLLTN